MSETNRKLIARLSAFGIKAAQFFAQLPYRRMGRGVVRMVGDAMHYLLFKWLLPKKYRNLTKQQLYVIIFKSDTQAGKKFDIWLLVLIFFNLLIMMLDSVPSIHHHLKIVLLALEWACTIFFTFEYYLRVYCLKRPLKYIFSFYGIIDFISIFPAYLSIFLPATQTLSVLRILRSLRLFRVLKLQRFIDESNSLLEALRRSIYKILIFMMFVALTAVVLGAMVYMFENGHNPQFDNMLQGIYWAVVTLTTVGYGDITPVTHAGRFISVVVMILGYCVIAVLTGIVTVETVQARRTEQARRDAKGKQGWDNTHKRKKDVPFEASDGEEEVRSAVENMVADEEEVQVVAKAKFCPHCGYEETDEEATYCKVCGTRLKEEQAHNWLNDFFGK
ncbi:MAG: ion transporter [Bacteroidales bacterium]|nr:ion transporter [Bacteroidales bacterium]